MNLLGAFQSALGANPSTLRLLQRSPGEAELELFLAARTLPADPSPAPRTPNSIVPLISHHQFNEGGLFVPGEKPIALRAITYLLAFDGLVISDPSAGVAELWTTGFHEQSLAEFTRLCDQVAEIEDLLAHGVIRVTGARPGLEEADRAEVLTAFGLDPGLTVFTNFINAYDAAMQLDPGARSAYVHQAQELLRLLGIAAAPLRSVDAAQSVVTRAGRALIHLSWQLAVNATDADCDITINDPFEEALLDELLRETSKDPSVVADSVANTRHFQRLRSATVPNLDTVDLTISDTLTIRSDDTYASFRDSLHSALDGYESRDGTEPRKHAEARKIFEQEMRLAGDRLSARVKKTPVRGRVRDIGISTALAVAGMTLPSGSAAQLAAGLAATPAVGVLAKWLTGRSRRDPRQIAVRYCAQLGRLNASNQP